MEQELQTLPEHLSSPPVFSGVTRSLVLYLCFVDRCLFFCTFSFDHCVVCSSSIYGFWLPPFGIFKLFLCFKGVSILWRIRSRHQYKIFWKSDVWKFNVPEIPPLCFFFYSCQSRDKNNSQQAPVNRINIIILYSDERNEGNIISYTVLVT